MINENKNSKVWYKEPWPWILIAIVLIGACLSLSLVWFAVHSSNDLVYDSKNQDEEFAKKQNIIDKRTQNLNINADLYMQDDLYGGLLIVNGEYNDKDPLRIKFIHPASKNQDVILDLIKSSANSKKYLIKFKKPLYSISHWYIELTDTKEQWRLKGKWNMKEGNFIKLLPVLNVGK